LSKLALEKGVLVLARFFEGGCLCLLDDTDLVAFGEEPKKDEFRETIRIETYFFICTSFLWTGTEALRRFRFI
jgi:hypothetical protein